MSQLGSQHFLALDQILGNLCQIVLKSCTQLASDQTNLVNEGILKPFIGFRVTRVYR